MDHTLTQTPMYLQDSHSESVTSTRPNWHHYELPAPNERVAFSSELLSVETNDPILLLITHRTRSAPTSSPGWHKTKTCEKLSQVGRAFEKRHHVLVVPVQ